MTLGGQFFFSSSYFFFFAGSRECGEGKGNRSFFMESLYSGNFYVLEISSIHGVGGGKFGIVTSVDSTTDVSWDQLAAPR